MKVNSNVLIGFAMGATIPVIGFAVIQYIFDWMMDAGIIGALGSPHSVVKRIRTIAVLAIALNLIPFQIYKGRRSSDTMRGVLIATFIYAVIWIIYFWDSIRY